MGLIDTDEAVEHFRRVIDATTNNKDAYNEGFVDALEFCITTLSTMPVAEKIGKWEDVPHKSVEHGSVVIDARTVRCPVCRHAYKAWNASMDSCPECGAKMEANGNE